MTGTLTTFPASGSTDAYRFVVGSCSFVNDSAGFKVLDCIRALSPVPAFYLHIGDLTYDDNVDGNDPAFLAALAADPLSMKRNPRYYVRGFKKWPEVQAVNDIVPAFLMVDDHDFVFNDYEWNTVISGSSYSTVGAAARTAWLETAPYPTPFDPAGEVLGYQFDFGASRFIVGDYRSLRRYTNGAIPTFLGNSSGPGTFDQYTAVANAIAQAATDQVKLLHFVVDCTWANGNDGYGAAGGVAVAAGVSAANSVKERRDLCNAIRAAEAAYPSLRCVIHVGDMHMCAADDGGTTSTDFSTGGIPHVVQFVSSPWQSTSLNDASWIYTWNGVSAKHSPSDNLLAVYDVAAGHQQITATFYDCVTGSAVQIGQYSTADLASWA